MLQAASPGEQQWGLSKPSSVLLSLVPLLKKEKPCQGVLPNGQKESLLKGAGFHFTHIVSGAFLASSFPRSLTSQPAWNRDISSCLKSLGCT